MPAGNAGYSPIERPIGFRGSHNAPEKAEMKICIWTNIPNHYQGAFIGALDKICDIRVVYFGRVSRDRIALGWSDFELSDREIKCTSLVTALEAIPDWRTRIHIVPGYGGTFQRRLARHLTAHSVPWADWSESSTPGLRWYGRLPIKLWWTYLLAKGALG